MVPAGRTIPAVAGYSGTPLAKKLGIKAGHVVAVLGGPAGFPDALGPLPDDVALRSSVPDHADVVVLFTTERAELDARLLPLGRAVHPAGMVWVAWPKK